MTFFRPSRIRAESERRQASLIGDEEAFDLHVAAAGASNAGPSPVIQHGNVATRRHEPNELGQLRSGISGTGALYEVAVAVDPSELDAWQELLSDEVE